MCLTTRYISQGGIERIGRLNRPFSNSNYLSLSLDNCASQILIGDAVDVVSIEASGIFLLSIDDVTMAEKVVAETLEFPALEGN